MNYTHRLTTNIAKIIGWGMAIVFSFVAFAHGQTCTLPRWDTLSENQTVYGYSTILWNITWQNYLQGCTPFSGAFSCINWSLQWSNPNIYKYSLNQCQSWIPKSCSQWSGGILNHGQTTYGYSALLWAKFWVNYVEGCTPFSGTLTCINWAIQWENPTNFPYTYNQCLNTFTPKNCSDWEWGIIYHGTSVTWYSSTNAKLPKSCDKNFSTMLTCINGETNGNWQTYKYAICTWEQLIPGVDLAIDSSPWLVGQDNTSGGLIAQWSSPQITLLIQNKWTDIVNQEIPSPWFITCRRIQQNIDVHISNPIVSFVVNPGTKVGINIRIKSLFTQSLGAKSLACTINTPMIGGDVNPANNIWTGVFEVVKADRFDLALNKSISTISKNLESAEGAKGAQWLQNFLYNKIMNVLLPLIIILWILSAILWFYKIMFSSEDTATKEWTRYIIYWVIGIILIVSAKFIGQNVFDLLNPPSGDIKWYDIASWLYDKIIYPFIKFAIYLVLGAMFIILLSRVITFLFGTDSDAQKKAGTLIGWNVIAMLIIIWAKQIVEAIYGKQAAVVKDITNLWEIGSWVLADKNIPILYQVINYALGIASLVILVIIIIQTIKLLTKPDDPAQLKNIKNSLLYMFIGIFVLGAGYLIVNFAIIN